MTPQEKAAWRFAYAQDVRVVREVMRMTEHIELAEHMLRHRGILPELLLYIEGIGKEAAR